MAVSNKVKACLLMATIIVLAGCNSSDSNNTATTTQVPQTTVKILDSVTNCKSKMDVPNCHFDNGIYVIKLSAKVTDDQQQRVIKRVTNMMQWAHQDVRDQFSAKRIVLGLIEDEDALQSATGEFVIELNEHKGTIIDGIELIYTAIEGEDETLSPTTYQKMMQLYDYYVDGDSNTATGTALNASYSSFKGVLLQAKVAAEGMGLAYLEYDECNYGNGQLKANRALGTPNLCPDDDGDKVPNGKLDEVHSLAINLNPGALLGTVYEYQVEANLNTAAGELLSSDGLDFTDEGNIGSASDLGLTDKNKLFVSWANPAFLPFKQYLDTYFFVNKK